MELFLKSFEIFFSLTLEKFPPLKQKYIRYNNSAFINRTLRKNVTWKTIRSNIMCVSIFYVKVKSSTLTTLTLQN